VIDWTKPRKEFDRYLRGLVGAGYGKRIMFGSDQMVWPEAIEMAVAAVQSADYLTAEQRGDIFYHNAARFLRLEPERPVAPKGAMETLPR
jgi:predicted TIM-barrel fold metal-dependent hydrolase